ncbi:BcBOA9 protein [Ustulina deusta]|nr:BcBOA9 protein [Ustulina deusta]
MAPMFDEPSSSSEASGPSSRSRTPSNGISIGYNGSEPIAIVGMACRFPGQSDTPADFWELLVQQRSGYSEPPSSRFNIDGFHSEKANTGSLGPRGGYFISEDVYNFDPPFFGITQTEAIAMDPQQRKLLECVYEAFEAGGIPLDSVSGKNIGTYVGNFTIDYGMMALRDMEYPKPYSMTGHGNTILSNRVSYVFNLCGPSGEINGAVVGGTNLILDAAVQMAVDKMGVLSHTSTCHTFDASADGYGRAEGIGALYLKRLSDAIRDGDPIRGVIRGTAANANGKTSGITQPSAIGQEAVIRKAYAFAGNLNPDETSYFECHGTGTPVGDPIELNAITNMFLKDSKRDSLLIGAVKTNVGHAEAASAMASIVKVVLAMELGTIPASIGVKNYNPKINFSNGRLQVVKDTLEWPTGYNVRRASVNSFGYGGANAHAIIESSESYLPGYKSFKKRGTSRDPTTTQAPSSSSSSSRTLNDFPKVASQYEMLDLAFTLGTRRSFFFNRGYAIASADTVVNDLDADEMTFGKRGNGAKIAFIFTELMENIPSYLKSIRDMDRILQKSILEPKTTSAIDRVHLSQPICTAVQVALVKLLREWGVTPLACVGHSSGEIAAAYAAGAITDEQAILAAYFRGVAVDKLTQKGTMLAVGLGPEEAAPYLEEGIRIACYNSPQSVTLSGDEDAAANVKAKLEADGIFVRALKTSGRAYHSHHMKDVGAIYEECANRGFAFLDALEFPKREKDAKLPVFISSPGPEYWRQNLESPLEGLGINHIVEIGPHSALAGPIRQLRDKLGVSSRDLEYSATLSRGENSGYPIDLARVNSIEDQDRLGNITLRKGIPLVDLPRYAWNYSAGALRAKHRTNMEFQNRKFARHDLLGSIIPGVIRDQAQWRNMLDIHDLPWLEQHKLGSQPVFPATGYIAVAVEAARQFFHEKVKFEAALNLPPSGTAIEVMTSVRFQPVSNAVSSTNWLEFTIQSFLEGIWTEHCVVVPLFDESRVQEPRTSHTWYRGFSNIGLNYGAAFNGLSDIRTDPWTNECVADTKLLPIDVPTDDSRYIVHPGAMDTCLQGILIAAHNGSLKGANRSFIPVDWEEVSIYSYEGTDMPASADFSSLRALFGAFQLSAPDGRPLFTAKRVNSITYAEDLNRNVTEDRHPYLRVLWKPDVETLEKAVSTPAEDSLTQTLDLLGHKYPGMNILEVINSETDLSRKLPAVLEGDSSLKRYNSFTYLAATDALVEASADVYPDGRDVSAEKMTIFENGEYGTLEGVTYDLVILPEISSFDRSAAEVLTALQPFLNENGRLLIHCSNREGTSLNEEFWSLLDLLSREISPGTTLPDTQISTWKIALDGQEIATQVIDESASGWTLLSEPARKPKPTKDVVVLSRDSSANTTDFSGELTRSGYAVQSASLSDKAFTPQADAIYVSIVELGSSLFNGNLNATEFANLQRLADSTQAVFWITSGDLLGKVDPNAAIVQGLGRTLQTEYVQLTFIAIDLDHSDARRAAKQTLRVLDRFSKESDSIDKEYIVKDDVFHISRLAQDTALDEEYGTIIAKEAADEEYDATVPIRLDIEKIGLLDTLHFKADERDRVLKFDEAEVEVKAVGLNMKEYATFRGSFHSESLSHEGAGIVRRIGSDVTNVKVGDKDGLSFEEMAGMPLVFATAVYGLLYLGRLKKGEKVLIHSATGGVGLAAVQIAKMVGAEIFATVGTPAKREFLKREYGLEDSHIFSSRNTSFAAEIMAATNGRGIDVALNSLVRELLAASWSVMANNGRHIEIGRTDIMEFGILDLNVFKRNTTFSAFDFGVVADDHPEIVASVMKDVMKYLREGKICPLQPMALFPATQVSAAFAEFANPHRIGKVVVSFGPDSGSSRSLIAVRREHKGAVKFKADGTYILIGCLGGLGRCLARFMVDRGARNLTFLGRGGADKKEAAALIDSLRARGCVVNVVRGDVSNKEDVAKAVRAARVPVYGMVQGAMALEDKLFSKLDLPGWQYPIDPKVRGTWNLHECLAGQPLDFFVMLSSISAMTGAPTQSNYCAANTFLDFFARYRDGLGLPATTVGLSMVLEVGFVSQNLAIEQGISRSGIHGITERDFLMLMEQAMKPGRVGGWRLDAGAKNFLVSGLEPARLAADLDVHGFRFWLQPRVGPLLTAIQRKNEGSGRGGAGGAKAVLGLDDILEATVEKFARTFMIPSDDVDPSKPLVAYGMDSMIGTALRNWGFSSFGVDIPASDFMGPVLTAQSLAEKIFAGRS